MIKDDSGRDVTEEVFGMIHHQPNWYEKWNLMNLFMHYHLTTGNVQYQDMINIMRMIIISEEHQDDPNYTIAKHEAENDEQDIETAIRISSTLEEVNNILNSKKPGDGR